MAREKTMKATVSIGGVIHPSLQRTLSRVHKSVGFLVSKYKALGAITLTGAVAGVASLGAITAKSVGQAIELQKEMSNVATLLDGDVHKRVGELQKDVLDLSDTTSVFTSDLTNGLYETISAFGDNEETIKRVGIAAKAAKAGNATTIESIRLLSAVTKGYGDTSAAAMEKAADMSFQIVKLGQTTFPDLAASMGRVVPMAAAMHIKLEELSGAYATLTGVTGGAAEVSTQLRAVIQGFVKPSKEMAAAIKQSGYKSGQAMLQTLGLHKSLLLLKKGCRGNALALTSLFGSVESGTAILALVGAQSDNMAAKTKAMFEASGIAEKAYTAQMDNFAAKWAKIVNIARNFMTKIGIKILPLLERMADKALPHVINLSEKLVKVLDSAGESITKYLEEVDFEKVIHGLKDTYKFVVKNWKFFVGVFGGALVVAIGAAVVSIGWIPFAIAGVVAAAAWLWNSWDDICGWINDRISSVVNWFQTNMPGLVGVMQRVYEGIKEVLSWLYERFRVVFDAVLAVVKVIGPPILDFIKATLSVVLQQVEVYIKKVIAWIERICTAFNRVYDVVKPLFPLIGQMLETAFRNSIQRVIDMLKVLMKWIQNVFAKINSMIESVANIQQAVTGKVKGWFGFGGESMPAKAAGGFTSGPSICGEAGTEAVISFDPRYRAANQGYLMTAAEMLGMDVATPVSESRQSVVNYNVGGITFSPVIKAGEGTSKRDIIRQLREVMPDLIDMIEDGLNERSKGRYA